MGTKDLVRKGAVLLGMTKQSNRLEELLNSVAVRTGLRKAPRPPANVGRLLGAGGLAALVGVPLGLAGAYPEEARNLLEQAREGGGRGLDSMGEGLHTAGGRLGDAYEAAQGPGGLDDVYKALRGVPEPTESMQTMQSDSEPEWWDDAYEAQDDVNYEAFKAPGDYRARIRAEKGARERKQGGAYATWVGRTLNNAKVVSMMRDYVAPAVKAKQEAERIRKDPSGAAWDYGTDYLNKNF